MLMLLYLIRALRFCVQQQLRRSLNPNRGSVSIVTIVSTEPINFKKKNSQTHQIFEKKALTNFGFFENLSMPFIQSRCLETPQFEILTDSLLE